MKDRGAKIVVRAREGLAPERKIEVGTPDWLRAIQDGIRAIKTGRPGAKVVDIEEAGQ